MAHITTSQEANDEKAPCAGKGCGTGQFHSASREQLNFTLKDFLGSQWLRLSFDHGVWVQFRLGLRSHMPPHSQKNQTIKQEQYCYKFNKNLKLIHIKNKKSLKNFTLSRDHAQTKSQIPSNQVLHDSQEAWIWGLRPGKPMVSSMSQTMSQWWHYGPALRVLKLFCTQLTTRTSQVHRWFEVSRDSVCVEIMSTLPHATLNNSSFSSDSAEKSLLRRNLHTSSGAYPGASPMCHDVYSHYLPLSHWPVTTSDYCNDLSKGRCTPPVVFLCA